MLRRAAHPGGDRGPADDHQEVTTPLGGACRGEDRLKDVVGIVPILRAGLGMAGGVIELLHRGRGLGIIGLYRDESTLRPEKYYNRFPVSTRITLALLVDPMLATGSSAVRGYPRSSRRPACRD